jgi:hypothetical protein
MEQEEIKKEPHEALKFEFIDDFERATHRMFAEAGIPFRVDLDPNGTTHHYTFDRWYDGCYKMYVGGMGGHCDSGGFFGEGTSDQVALRSGVQTLAPRKKLEEESKYLERQLGDVLEKVNAFTEQCKIEDETWKGLTKDWCSLAGVQYRQDLSLSSDLLSNLHDKLAALKIAAKRTDIEALVEKLVKKHKEVIKEANDLIEKVQEIA